jgi:hypothetical protein
LGFAFALLSAFGLAAGFFAAGFYDGDFLDSGFFAELESDGMESSVLEEASEAPLPLVAVSFGFAGVLRVREPPPDFAAGFFAAGFLAGFFALSFSVFFSSAIGYSLSLAVPAPEWARKVRVGANSPSLWPTIDSEM